MADEPLTLAVLAKFHRDILAPEFARIGERFDRIDGTLDEFRGHFDEIARLRRGAGAIEDVHGLSRRSGEGA